jgi:hypothetical protein
MVDELDQRRSTHSRTRCRPRLVTATSSDDDHYDLYIVTVDGDVHQVTQAPNAYTAFLWGQTPS